jgi:hypothetical protein
VREVKKLNIHTTAFTSFVARLDMRAEPYSTRVGVSPNKAFTATYENKVLFVTF